MCVQSQEVAAKKSKYSMPTASKKHYLDSMKQLKDAEVFLNKIMVLQKASPSQLNDVLCSGVSTYKVCKELNAKLLALIK